MPAAPVEFQLSSEDASGRFGAALGLGLHPGRTVLLEGPVGAGKSHIARAAIRALVGSAVDVPSPSFTLVQTYDGPECEIWHADLYRLTSADEVIELGLAEAMDQAIVLIEWPDRLGRLAPVHALRVVLSMAGDGRTAMVTGADQTLLERLTEALK
jgi:tRNA threonylcarbamoyladenosine biosynthesis protein TsaE